MVSPNFDTEIRCQFGDKLSWHRKFSYQISGKFEKYDTKIFDNFLVAIFLSPYLSDKTVSNL